MSEKRDSPEIVKWSLRQELVQTTRDRIKNSARACFKRYGYRSTTIRKIASEAGSVPNTLYQHFDGKTGILLALCDDQEPVWLKAATELDELLPDLTLSALSAWLDNYTAIWLDNRTVIEAYWEALGEVEVGNHFWPIANKQADQMKRLLSCYPDDRSDYVRHRMCLVFILISQTLFVVHSSAGTAHTRPMLDALLDMLWTSLNAWKKGEIITE